MVTLKNHWLDRLCPISSPFSNL